MSYNYENLKIQFEAAGFELDEDKITAVKYKTSYALPSSIQKIATTHAVATKFNIPLSDAAEKFNFAEVSLSNPKQKTSIAAEAAVAVTDDKPLWLL